RHCHHLNGEIYKYWALRAEVEADGSPYARPPIPGRCCISTPATPPMTAGTSASRSRSRRCSRAAGFRDRTPPGIGGFHFHGSPRPFVPYRNIRPLPAGHRQRVNVVRSARASAFSPASPQSLSLLLPTWVSARDSVRANLLADIEVRTFLFVAVDSIARV